MIVNNFPTGPKSQSDNDFGGEKLTSLIRERLIYIVELKFQQPPKQTEPEEVVSPEEQVRQQEERARRQREIEEKAAQEQAKQEGYQKTIEQFSAEALAALRGKNPDSASKIEGALKDARVNQLEALIMSEIAANESMENAILAINLLRRPLAERYSDLFFDQDGLIQAIVYDPNGGEKPPSGVKSGVSPDNTPDNSKDKYRAEFLTPPLQIDPQGNVIYGPNIMPGFSSEGIVIKASEIANAKREPFRGIADLTLLDIQRSRVWQSVRAANQELGELAYDTRGL